jgi:hypothetical protein
MIEIRYTVNLNGKSKKLLKVCDIFNNPSMLNIKFGEVLSLKKVILVFIKNIIKCRVRMLAIERVKNRE